MAATKSTRARGSDGAIYLDQLRGRSRDEQLKDPSPRRVAALLAALGDPHRRFPVVHVTGTNGKGSVAALTATLLAGNGLRVGLFTGPHLTRVNERITIAGREVSDQALREALRRVARAANDRKITPGWFEAITVAALWLFATHRVDAAVVEVGMLGRFDPTNVLDAGTVVITNVELDHDAEAGGGRPVIAAEKAQIVRPGSTLILGETDASLRPIFQERAPSRILMRDRDIRWARRRASLHGSLVDLTNPWGTRRDVTVGMIGAHQCDNAILALTASEAFLDRPISRDSAAKALARTRLAGRFEIRHRSPLVVLDGAHNAAAARTLRRAVSEISARMKPRVLLYGLRPGRTPATFLRECQVENVDRIVVTEVDNCAGARAEAAAAAEEFGVPVAVIDDPRAALERAVRAAGPNGLVVATGSLRLVGQLRTVRLPKRDPHRDGDLLVATARRPRRPQSPTRPRIAPAAPDTPTARPCSRAARAIKRLPRPRRGRRRGNPRRGRVAPR